MADKIEPVAWRATWADDWTDFADHNSTPGVDDPEAWKSFKQPPMEITPLYSQQQLDALVARAERAEAEAAANREDAERYRFIRDANRSDPYLDTDDLALYAMESLDKVIDAAIDAARGRVE